MTWLAADQQHHSSVYCGHGEIKDAAAGKRGLEQQTNEYAHSLMRLQSNRGGCIMGAFQLESRIWACASKVFGGFGGGRLPPPPTRCCWGFNQLIALSDVGWGCGKC